MGRNNQRALTNQSFNPAAIGSLYLWLDGTDSSAMYTGAEGPVTPVTAPTDISGCQFWLDGADLSTMFQDIAATTPALIGDAVGLWRDKSGNSRHVQQTTAAKRPVRATTAFSAGAVHFDGLDDVLSNQTPSEWQWATGGSMTWIFVGRRGDAPSVSADYRYWFGTGEPLYNSNVNSFGIFAWDYSNVDGRLQFVISQGSAHNRQNVTFENNSAPDATNWVHTLAYDSVAPTTVMRGQGASRPAAVVITNIATTTTTPTFGLSVGADSYSSPSAYSGSRFGDIRLAEVCAFNRRLTDTEIASVERYLALKWGVSGVHSQVTSAGQPAGYWADKSGGARHVTQSTAGQRPVMSFLNGLSALLFTSASSQFLTGAGAFLTGDPSFTMFVVWQKLVAQNIPPFGWGSQNTGALFFLNPTQLGGTASGYTFGGATTYNFVLNNGDPDSFHPLNKTWFDCFVKPAGPVIGAAAYRSGQYFPPASAATAAPNISAGAFVIGRTPGLTSYLDGLVGEILIYNKVLTTSERNQVEQYISKKWRITLANYKLATSVAAPAVSSPLALTDCALWLDGNDAATLYNTAAGPVTAVTAPTDISGCVGWWDASDASSITQSGGLVSQWNDKSGNGRHATATGTLRPTYTGTQNGRAVVTFDGTGNRMNTTLVDLATQTILFVAKAAAAGAPGTRRVVSYQADRGFYASSGWNWWSPNAGTGVSPTEYNVASGVITSDTSMMVYGNGVAVSASFDPFNAGTNTFVLGGEYAFAVSNLFQGEIAEVIVFNSALSNANRARIEKYLANKWAINGVHDQPGIGQPVGYWGDKSGNGRHFTTTSATARPTRAPAGRAGVVFNASPLLNTAANLTVTAQTTVVVTSLDSTVNNSRIFSQTLASGSDFSVSGHYIPLMRNATNASISSWTDSSNRAAVSVANSVGAVMASVHTGTSIVNYVNGVRSASYAPTAALNLAIATMSLMSDQSSASTSTGRVSAVLVYNRALSAAEIAALTAHLSATYGLGVLSPISGHPEVQNWIARVYANGGSVSQFTADQVTSFAREIDAAGLRSRLYRVNLFCGNDINAAYVPLYRGPTASGAQYGNSVDTNSNFVAADYVESGASAGLTSNGTTKALTTGVWANTFGLNDNHLSIYGDNFSFNSSGSYATAIGSRAGPSNFELQVRHPLTAENRFLATDSNSTAVAGSPVFTSGHLIGTATAQTDARVFVNGWQTAFSNTTSRGTGVLNNNQIAVFGYGQTQATASIAERISGALRGYSIGAGLTPTQAQSFSQIMERFQQRLGRGLRPLYSAADFASITNTDASAWVQNVYLSGGSVSLSTAQAVNTFCNAVDSAGIRDRFYRLNLFCGGNLQACLVPLYRGPSAAGTQYGNTADWNVAFALGDYIERGTDGGLTGDGSTKRLLTGMDMVTAGIPYTDSHASWYSRSQTTGNGTAIGSYGGGVAQVSYGALAFGGLNQIYYRSGGASNCGIEGQTWSGANRSGHILCQRNASDAKVYRSGTDLNLTVTMTNTNNWSVTSPGAPSVFARNRADTSNSGDQFLLATLQGYSIGLSMNATQVTAYYTAMQAFQTALSRNV